EVVQAGEAGRADVHARALADGFEALEDLDVLGAVRVSLLSQGRPFARARGTRRKSRRSLVSGWENRWSDRETRWPQCTSRRPSSPPTGGHEVPVSRGFQAGRTRSSSAVTTPGPRWVARVARRSRSIHRSWLAQPPSGTATTSVVPSIDRGRVRDPMAVPTTSGQRSNSAPR